MSITYLQAFEILDAVAQEYSTSTAQYEEKVPLLASVGRICARQITNPSSIPAFDTSAMDGYALDSSLTVGASIESPVFFQVVGTVAAGDRPVILKCSAGAVLPSCSEIMTGAQFPCDSNGKQLDACLPVELAQLVDVPGNLNPCLRVTSPIRANQHRRFAGSDIVTNHVVLERGQMINTQNLMTLATLGITEVHVVPKVQIGVCSTGSELIPFDSKECSPCQIRDSNGPYVRYVLQEFGTCVTQFEPVADDMIAMEFMLRQFLHDENDILVTTGGVSAGRFDFVRESIELLGARVRFHKVAIRPGHPVLFGTFENTPATHLLEGHTPSYKKKAFFGLPGNPIAAAACLQFFVIPFLKRFRGEPYPQPVHARVKNLEQQIPTCNGTIRKLPQRAIDTFRHGHLQLGKDGFEVITNQDQASYKVSPIAQSNCWVWFPSQRTEIGCNDLLPCFPFSPLDKSFTRPQTSLIHDKSARVSSEVRSKPLDSHYASKPLKVVVLAGGLSTRMKQPKHLLLFSDGHLAYEVLLHELREANPSIEDRDIYLSLRNSEEDARLRLTHFHRHYDVLPCETITDKVATEALLPTEDIGPAAGLLSVYTEDPTADWLAIACDFPLLNSECLRQLLAERYPDVKTSNTDSSHCVTCFVNGDGFYEPLLAIWTAAGLERLRQNVLNGTYGPSRTIMDLARLGRVKSVIPKEDHWILNANTPAELNACLTYRVAGYTGEISKSDT